MKKGIDIDIAMAIVTGRSTDAHALTDIVTSPLIVVVKCHGENTVADHRTDAMARNERSIDTGPGIEVGARTDGGMDIGVRS
jgi:hypothetical protein